MWRPADVERATRDMSLLSLRMERCADGPAVWAWNCADPAGAGHLGGPAKDRLGRLRAGLAELGSARRDARDRVRAGGARRGALGDGLAAGVPATRHHALRRQRLLGISGGIRRAPGPCPARAADP